MKITLRKIILLSSLLLILLNTKAQNIFSGEPVQLVGSFNGYTTTPYNSDYRTSVFRRVSTNTGTPVDGRGQWNTVINVQNSGGDVAPINMPGGNSNGFLFISGPSTNRFQNKWVFSNIGQGAINSTNDITAYNSGEDMGFDMSTTGYYTFNFNDCGYTQTNAAYFVGYTNASPVSVTRSSQMSNPSGSLTVGITSTTSLSPQEYIYVRYTTGADFASSGSSSIVQATGTATAYTATIPTFANGTIVRYFVFTSTLTLAQLNAATEVNKSLSVLKYDDNTSANYVYTTTVLPVKISLFSGKQINESNVLEWRTEGEINIDRYEILHSTDGINFNTLGKVISKNIFNGHTYQWIDSKIFTETNYYKLVIVEKDGLKSNSNILRISTSIKNKQLNIFPSPAVNYIEISIPFSKNTAFGITIYNAIGQKVYVNNNYKTEASKIRIPLPNTFTKGHYTILLNANEMQFNGNFIVL